MRLIALLILASLVLATPALAKPDPQVTALRREVAALKAQIAGMQQQIVTVRNESICNFASGQDSFRVVFTALSKISLALTGSNIPPWETIPRFDDQGACTAIGVARP